MCPPFCCKTHSRRRHHSLMLDACETFRHASLHIEFPINTKFIAVQADVDGLYPIFPSSDTVLLSIYSAPWPDWFCSTSYAAKILVAVVESESGLLLVLPDSDISCYEVDEYRVN